MAEIVQFLQAAIDKKKALTVAYGGGSKPGAPRKLIIIDCFDDKMKAVEPGQRFPKLFKIGKILWAEDAQGNRIENPSVKIDTQPTPSLPKFDTLEEYVSLIETDLKKSGWYICKNESSFGVGTFFKNGKQKKTPSVEIRYFDPSTEEVFDIETGELVEVIKEITGRERPWRVDSWRFKNGRSFSLLCSAMELFFNEVRESNPNEAKGMYSGH